MDIKNKKLALYTEDFLTPSMTFIYRQLTSLPDDWDTFVMSRTRINDVLFPYKDVYCCSRKLDERILNKIYKTIGIRYLSLNRQSSNYFLSALKKENPSLIHAHFGPSALEILPIAKRLAIPMVTTFHGFDASKLLIDKNYTNQLKDLFSYSYVLTVSESMKNQLIAFGAPRNRTKCAYIGVPVEKFKQQNRTPLLKKFRANEEIIFLQVSNFVEKKGHQYTLAAFSELLDFYSDAKLLFAGDGPLREQMEALATELNIRHAIEFLGHKNTNDVIELMKNADCFVHHSITSSNGDKEGIPTVLMEAMASGLPVISTIHAGIPELVQTQVNGYLVEEKDIRAYVSSLRTVLEDDGIIGINARETIEEKFNMDKQIKLLIATYNEIINEKHTETKYSAS